MKFTELKPLLKQGDCKEVAQLCNVSTTFVQNVWREKTRGTPGADAVMLATSMIIAEREAYSKKIREAVMHQREQRKQIEKVANTNNSAL